MTPLEIFFAVLGIILSAIGIIVGIIGAKALLVSNKNQYKIKNIDNSSISIDQSISNGLSSNDIKNIASNISRYFLSLYEKQNEIQLNNFIKIMKETSLLIQNTNTSVTKPDEIWTLKFFQYSANASDINIQKLWAKLLQAKLTCKSDISMRTMELLSNLSPNEAIIFDKICKHIILNKVASKNYIDKNNYLTFEEIQILRECSLLATNDFLNYTINFNSNSYYSIVNGDYLLIIKVKDPKTKTFVFQVYGLTRAGKELHRALDYRMNDLDFINYAKWLKLNNTHFIFSLHKIISIEQDQINYDTTDIIDM